MYTNFIFMLICIIITAIKGNFWNKSFSALQQSGCANKAQSLPMLQAFVNSLGQFIINLNIQQFSDG